MNGNQADNSVENAGAAYVFRRVGATWSQEAYLKASNTDTDPQHIQDQFGISLALSRGIIAIGANQEDSAATGVNGNAADNSAPEAGAAYVFVRTGATWGFQSYVKASNTESGGYDDFGETLALTGGTLVVSALGEDSPATGINGNQGNGGDETGAAYVYRITFQTFVPLVLASR